MIIRPLNAPHFKKLPNIDPLYWVMILSANTIGEAGGDLISDSFNSYWVSTSVLVSLFALSMLIALLTKVQHPSIYWITIILSSTAGTTMSDLITRQIGTHQVNGVVKLGLGYGIGALTILVVMAVVFIAWRFASSKHSIEDPLTAYTEFLYWCAILCSSTLGTAFGDYISNGTALGFAGGSLVLLAVLSIIGAFALLTKVSRDVLYWLGIIVAHPLGATMGDYATKEEGLNLGNLKATIILAAIFLAIVAYKTIRGYFARKLEGPELAEETV